MSVVSEMERWCAVESAGQRRVARVLLDSALPQLDHLFDYAIPETLAPQLRIGQRVRVPFRSQQRNTFGYIIEFVTESEFTGSLSMITDLVSPVPMLSADVWRVARAVADRAGGSAGDILRLAIPSRQVRVEKRHLAQPFLAGSEATEHARGSTPAASHDAVIAPDQQTPETAVAAQLCAGARLAHTASHGLERLTTGEWVGGWAAQLARTARAVWASGRSVILIAPDYRDLDQLRDALAALGSTDILRVDSRQSAAERYAAFLTALDEQPHIILGNRSAVYAPAYQLGALLLWDDSDPVLAEPLAPYVHARDAALVRAEQSGAGLLFAAHARSIEVQRLIDLQYVQASAHPPKRTRVFHADAAVAPDASGLRLPDFAAQTIRAALATGPVLVQVATPGYSPLAVCVSCGELARCGACQGPIMYRAAGQPSCRWCGEHPRGWQCEACGGVHARERGMGAARTVEQFEQQFSGARVLLSDGAHPRERVDARPALVVATLGAEPIAAGGYHAVILLDSDRLIGFETLRAGEDCLRWWENAAALAAPEALCLITSGSGPVVQAFVTGQTERWLRAELADRHQLRYPPAVRVASVQGGVDRIERALATIQSLPGVDVLGPAPVSLARAQAGEHSAETVTQGGTNGRVMRAIVRFDYGQGAEVAQRLRGALVADAAGASSRAKGRMPGRAHPEALRLRFDDRGVFER